MKFYMLCGLPGCGKSTYAKKLEETEGAIVCASDTIRKELYGSEDDQEHNNEVFSILHNRVLCGLKSDATVVYDATNISSKQRRAFLHSLNKVDCEKIAVVFATPYEECVKRNAQRERKVPKAVIKRMYMNFTIPCTQEGFTRVILVYPDDVEFNSYVTIVENCFDVPHDNPHHSENIGRHMECAVSCLLNTYRKQLSLMPSDDGDLLEYATLLHDIGKPFAKVFKNTKGEDTDIAHYYNHENVGAYNILLTDIPENLKLDAALLIQYHMKFYTAYTQSRASYEKDKQFLGERLFNMLEILHDCDVQASFPVV